MLNTLIFLVCSYTGILASLYLWQDKLIFFPSKTHEQTPKDYNLSYENVNFPLNSQTNIHAWFIKPLMQRAV